jgi:WD40 repeat protein
MAKRAKMEEEGDSDEVPTQFNKEDILKQIFEGSYDFSFRFSVKMLPFQAVSGDAKARSICINSKIAFIAFHNNCIKSYELENEGKVKNSVEMEYHQQAVRCAQISDSDRVLVTASFDSVKVWDIDFTTDADKV